VASLTSARKAIASAVGGVSCIRASTYSFAPGGQSGLPLAFTNNPVSELHGTSSNSQVISLDVIVLVSTTSQQLAEEAVDSLLVGPDTLVAALIADRTFGGSVFSSEVTGSRSLSVVQMNQYQAWGHSWQINLLMAA
jgi:hypothetical protein